MFWVWRAALAAIIAVVFAQIDAYVARRGLGDTLAGRAWGAYRARGKKTPPPDRTGGPTEL